MGGGREGFGAEPKVVADRGPSLAFFGGVGGGAGEVAEGEESQGSEVAGGVGGEEGHGGRILDGLGSVKGKCWGLLGSRRKAKVERRRASTQRRGGGSVERQVRATPQARRAQA